MRALLLALLAAALSPAQTRDLQANMQAIAQALGVQCEYCHTAPRGSNQPEPKKDIARQMMAMTRDINARVAQATGKPDSAAQVECATCHRGVAIPRPLASVLRETLLTLGAAAASDQYRELRARYYGAATYDFSEATLINLAQPISTAKPDDAIDLLKTNLEFFPNSAKTYAAIAYAYTRKYDDASAITMLEKALEIEPANGIVQGQLEQLKSYQRRRK